jgi:uncharacterized membrane protein YesL
MENPIFSFMSKACDVIVLSLVWVVLCIPIVTIGPNNTAMYYAVVKVIRRERGYLLREYFKSFKLNFKKGLIIGVFLTLFYIVLGFDLMWAWGNLKTGGTKGSILMGVFVAITILVVCYTLYVFPILSRFEMTIKQLVRASIFMAIRHLPSTIAMLIFTAAGFLIVYILPVLFFIIPGSIVLLNSLLMERIFKKYMPKSETEEENTSKDEWYLE